MGFTQYLCARCGSEHIRRNGTQGGHANYQCEACGCQARFVPAVVDKAIQYAQVAKLLVERNSQRSIVRATGVARTMVAKLLKKRQWPRHHCRGCGWKRPNAIDEMWTFVGRRKRKFWLWLAVGRASRRIVPWVLGCRSAATARRLWAALPHRYQHYCRYHTNQWEACAKVLPARYRRPRPKGRGNTNIVEAFNCLLRHRCGVLVRKSCSLSIRLAND